MFISSNPVAAPAAGAPEQAHGAPARPVQMELLRSLLIVERLTEMADAAAGDPIDQGLENFWHGMVDDCVHRSGAELAQHNYQRNLRHIERKEEELMRHVEAMPPGPQRAQAQEKVAQFLAEQRRQIEAQHDLDAPKQPVLISLGLLRPALRSQPADSQTF